MYSDIPEQLYEQMVEMLPIFCVDIILLHKGKVLLLKRTEEPAKDNWWFIGGRVYKNERIEEAVQRITKKEIGVNTKIIRKVGFINQLFETSKFQNSTTGTHTPALVFLVESENKEIDIELDNTSKMFKWVDKIEEDFPIEIRTFLEKAEVFNNEQKQNPSGNE